MIICKHFIILKNKLNNAYKLIKNNLFYNFKLANKYSFYSLKPLKKDIK